MSNVSSRFGVCAGSLGSMRPFGMPLTFDMCSMCNLDPAFVLGVVCFTTFRTGNVLQCSLVGLVSSSSGSSTLLCGVNVKLFGNVLYSVISECLSFLPNWLGIVTCSSFTNSGLCSFPLEFLVISEALESDAHV